LPGISFWIACNFIFLAIYANLSEFSEPSISDLKGLKQQMMEVIVLPPKEDLKRWVILASLNGICP